MPGALWRSGLSVMIYEPWALTPMYLMEMQFVIVLGNVVPDIRKNKTELYLINGLF